MRSRAFTVAALALLGMVVPARAQLTRFELPEPPSTVAVGGQFSISWKDEFPFNLGGDCFYSVTWYYASQRDGSDRKRMTTFLRDDFSDGFRANWQPAGAALDWEVRSDRQRRYLVAPEAAAGPLFYKESAPRDTVLSVLVRPRGLRPEFTLGLRGQPNGRPGFEVQHDQNHIRLVKPGGLLAQKPALQIGPGRWYWYEVGVQTQKNRDVQVRLRVYDESRQRVLANFEPLLTRFAVGGVNIVSLLGPADIAEVYLDPWQARWADDPRNEFRWDTSRVPSGSYYVIAEISDGKRPPRVETSTYQVQIQ